MNVDFYNMFWNWLLLSTVTIFYLYLLIHPSASSSSTFLMPKFLLKHNSDHVLPNLRSVLLLLDPASSSLLLQQLTATHWFSKVTAQLQPNYKTDQDVGQVHSNQPPLLTFNHDLMKLISIRHPSKAKLRSDGIGDSYSMEKSISPLHVTAVVYWGLEGWGSSGGVVRNDSKRDHYNFKTITKLTKGQSAFLSS